MGAVAARSVVVRNCRLIPVVPAFERVVVETSGQCRASELLMKALFDKVSRKMTTASLIVTKESAWRTSGSPSRSSTTRSRI